MCLDSIDSHIHAVCLNYMRGHISINDFSMLSPIYKKNVKEELDQMLEASIIEPVE
jgi:hypothetical protein